MKIERVWLGQRIVVFGNASARHGLCRTWPNIYWSTKRHIKNLMPDDDFFSRCALVAHVVLHVRKVGCEKTQTRKHP